MPPEWGPHRSVWLAWPSDRGLWQDALDPAQDEFTAFCEAIADPDPVTGAARGERLQVLVSTPEAGAAATRALAGLGAIFHEIPYGDVWLRDTGPIFLNAGAGPERAAVRFGFNGWGGKYVLPHDAEVGRRIAEASGLRQLEAADFVLEGGSVEVDGAGLCLTTKQCLMNPNRNPGLSRSDVEARLRSALGVGLVLWLEEGLRNDHTDGHVDTLARFTAAGEALCMSAAVRDPNEAVLGRIERDLRSMTAFDGRPLVVRILPSPGAVPDARGEPMPASYVNYYVGNRTVVVPTYGVLGDGRAVDLIAERFPGRRTVGLSARAILAGGGAFHCISQQQPL